MTIRHLVGTIEQIESWQKAAKEDHFIRNQVPTKIIQEYTDRKTGIKEDIVMGLSVTDKDHMDRIYDLIYHPDYPRTNLAIITYDNEHILKNKDFAYTATQAWRDANIGSAINDKSTTEAEVLGFVFVFDEGGKIWF